MTAHITTGNQLDVVVRTGKDGKDELGLQRWHSNEFIPLPDPDGLIRVLVDVLEEQREKLNG